MTIRRNPGPDDDADDRSGPSHQWRHPSEVGLAVRGRSDRRRSAVIATGLVLGGVVVLVSGVLLGSMDDPDEPDDVVEHRIEQVVANVVVVDDDGVSSTVTGLVIDDEGHIAASADAVRGAEEIWARCADARMVAASLVAHDDDLAVLRLSSPAGRPVEVSEAVPSPGLDVLAVGAVPGAVSRAEATVSASDPSTPSDRFHAELASPDDGASLVFDADGRLMGMSTSGPGAAVVEVRTAAGMLGAAHRLLER